jgi:hypothetical protein
MRRWLIGVVVLALSVALLGCSDDSGKPDAAGDMQLDLPTCKHPTLSVCEPPPNMFSTTLWSCPCVPQNICNGGNPIAACNDSTNDCRYFVDSCYPLGYSPCDQNATDRVLGLCGACFFAEAGVRTAYDPLPKVCDQMQLDSGVAKDAPAVKDAPAAQ